MFLEAEQKAKCLTGVKGGQLRQAATSTDESRPSAAVAATAAAATATATAAATAAPLYGRSFRRFESTDRSAEREASDPLTVRCSAQKPKEAVKQ
uniref:Uncharacterized protein n=1 Tax=Syphacia muris TaxID=451379 RepID=A0A0N5AR76_9BILA